MFSLRSVSFSRRLAAGAVALAMVLAVSSRKALGGPPDKAVAASLPATPPGHGLDPADMDTTCKPCEDFYKYADGGWLKKNPIPPEYPSWGTFSELAERNRTALRKILERLAADKSAAPGSEEQKIGDFYASCMDEAAIEAQGARPLAPELERIEKIRNLADLEVELAYLQTHGVNALFFFGSQQDRKNSSEVIVGASQGGLGLPDRDYYTKTDGKSKELRDKYAAHVARMLVLLGDEPGKSAAEARTVIEIESKLAEVSMTRVERRDPDATYHRMAPAELKTLTPNFAWEAYFRDLGAPPIAAINIGQPKFFEGLDKQLTTVPLSDWKTYLRWHLVRSAAPGLSSKFVEENFDFYSRTLEGTKEMLPRWKRCVQSADRHLGFALGKLYVRENFPPEAKARADQMVKNLIAALREDLTTLPWMGAQTRKAALAKLDAFTPKIGYPDKWRDYSPYKIERGAHAVNVMNGALYEHRRDMDKVGKPVDRTEWGMTPPTVNAYYNAARNEIVFPAGILEPPFFDAKADDAVNYGGIGAVIGHEMTHGFDDQGRKFDAEGNLKNWWTPDDVKNYQERANCVEKQFDGYVVEGDLHQNGKLVLGESIADLGGLTIAYKAFQKSLQGKLRPANIDGFTPEQRLFLNWARVWATNGRPEFERLQTNTNPHPLGRFRAIGAPSNIPEFAAAFSCKAGDAMVRGQRCLIW
ncbi:MAG TPA: M13 family metallopeptidase [Thermoanaerobaculia bacterium]|nr:M13 family metallopeptidase [Thermoanaerobaculia bacterium]